MSRRDEMLREMGLTPVWRLRDRAAQPDVPVEATAGRAAPAVAPVTSPPAASGMDATPAATNNRRAIIMRMDWTALENRVSGCVDCRLHEQRNRTVF
ncbi:MAG TPA: hypothetical protein VNT02_15910, partial [Burkholderiales bacterium]|nr:hypothetical protein [Burkholderiales bacterium]